MSAKELEDFREANGLPRVEGEPKESPKQRKPSENKMLKAGEDK